MEEQETPSLDYTKGFNEGYILAKEAPDVADKISRVPNDTERMKGLSDGRRQFVLDMAHEQRIGKVVQPPSKQHKDKQKDKDIDRE